MVWRDLAHQHAAATIIRHLTLLVGEVDLEVLSTSLLCDIQTVCDLASGSLDTNEVSKEVLRNELVTTIVRRIRIVCDGADGVL